MCEIGLCAAPGTLSSVGEAELSWVRRLGLHLTEVAAARAYDRVAIKKWGPQEAAAKINFDVAQYDVSELDALSMHELVQSVRGVPLSKHYP